MAVGGQDEWPVHFYTAMLMMRILGKEGFEAAYQDKNGGFASADVIKAFQLFRDFAALSLFKAATWPTHTIKQPAPSTTVKRRSI